MSFLDKYKKYKKKYIKQRIILSQPLLPLPQLVPLVSNVKPLEVESFNINQTKNIKKSNKVIVKQFSGIVAASYYQVEEFNMKILILGTEHDYEPKNLSYCEPCQTGCYDLIKFIKEMSKTRCIDIFNEVGFHYVDLKSLEVLPNFINNIPIPSKRDIFKDINSFINSTKEKIISTSWNFSKITEEIIIKYLKDINIVASNNMLENIVKTNLSIISEDDFLNKYTKEELYNIVNQFGQNMIESKLDQEFLNKSTKNIRYHSWDTRKLYSQENTEVSIVFLFPYLFKISNNIEFDDTNFLNYKKEFDKTIEEMIENFYFGLNKIHPAMLIFYLVDDENLAHKGKFVYDSLYQIFLKYYPDWNKYQPQNIIPIVQNLIKKQISKSQLDPIRFIISMYKMYLDFNLIDFSYGLMITELYSIPRIFKKFNPTKHQKGDYCDNDNIFKNIIYVGGFIHGQYFKKFIDIYFNNQYRNLIQIKKSDLQMKVHTLGDKLMYNQLAELPIEDEDNYNKLSEKIQFRCIHLNPPMSFFD